MREHMQANANNPETMKGLFNKPSVPYAKET